MRSQFSNKQKLRLINQELADYVKQTKNENDRLHSLIAQDPFFFAQLNYDNYRKENFKDDKVIIRRRFVEGIMQNKLGFSTANSICKWINLSINSGLLSLNPTSSQSAIKGIYKPTPDTRYFINENKFFERETSLLNFG